MRLDRVLEAKARWSPSRPSEIVAALAVPECQPIACLQHAGSVTHQPQQELDDLPRRVRSGFSARCHDRCAQDDESSTTSECTTQSQFFRRIQLFVESADRQKIVAAAEQ